MVSTITNYWQLLWRIPVFIVLWIAFLLLKYPTVFVGFFVVPFMYRYRHKKFEDLPIWMKPWANPEDWWGGPEGTEESVPQWWINRYEGVTFWTWYKYHAIRNPANGLRTFEFLDLDIVPEKVNYIAFPDIKHYDPWYTRKYTPEVDFYGYLSWQGIQSCLKIIYHWNDEKHIEFKIGWRVNPRDRDGYLDPDGARSKGAGFATKFLPWRNG
jgi:hypothetical protein